MQLRPNHLPQLLSCFTYPAAVLFKGPAHIILRVLVLALCEESCAAWVATATGFQNATSILMLYLSCRCAVYYGPGCWCLYVKKQRFSWLGWCGYDRPMWLGFVRGMLTSACCQAHASKQNGEGQCHRPCSIPCAACVSASSPESGYTIHIYMYIYVIYITWTRQPLCKVKGLFEWPAGPAC